MLRNIPGVIAGLLIGGAVNMLIINNSATLIAPPEGSDLTTPEGLIAAMAGMEPKHFLMPFIAHALGTLVGAIIAALISIKNKLRVAIIVSLFFMAGGIIAVFMLPAPLWFDVVDLLLAYVPMGFLGAKLVGSRTLF